MGMSDVLAMAPAAIRELRMFAGRIEQFKEFDDIKSGIADLVSFQIAMWEAIQKK